MSLQELSNDLLVEIVDLVATDTYQHGIVVARGTKHLNQLALCSRRLNGIATAVLYRSYTQTGHAALPRFLLRVLRNPDLRKYVKMFVASVVDEDEKLDMSSFAKEDFQLCLNPVIAICSTSEDSILSSQNWMNDIRSGSWDALTALLLSILPNVEDVDMVAYGTIEECRYLNHILALGSRPWSPTASTHPSCLQHLKSVHAAYWDTESGMSIDTILPLLQPQNVKKAYFHMVAAESWEARPLRFALTDLSLNYCRIEGEALIHFIRCFPALEKFYYKTGGAIVGYSDFLPQKVGKAAQHLKGCLRSLIVDCDPGDEENFSADEEPKSMGSFADFEKLHTIATNADILLGPPLYPNGSDSDNENGLPEPLRLVNILPKSLRTFGLNDCGVGVLDQAVELIERKNEIVPHLETLGLTYWDLRPGGWERNLSGEPGLYPGFDKIAAQRLAEDCTAVGVKLNIALRDHDRSLDGLI